MFTKVSQPRFCSYKATPTAGTLRDAIYGAAIADAMGVPYEFKARGSYVVADTMVGHLTHNQEPGTFSDDTSMTLATCDSIRSTGTIASADIRSRFLAWMGDGYSDDASRRAGGKYSPDGVVFDVGSTTSQALSCALFHLLSRRQATGRSQRFPQ